MKCTLQWRTGGDNWHGQVLFSELQAQLGSIDGALTQLRGAQAQSKL